MAGHVLDRGDVKDKTSVASLEKNGFTKVKKAEDKHDVKSHLVTSVSVLQSVALIAPEKPMTGCHLRHCFPILNHVKKLKYAELPTLRFFVVN